MNHDELRYRISIGLIPKIGPVTARKLIAACGSAEGVFREKRANLSRIPGIGKRMTDQVMQFKSFERAEKEVEYIVRHGIRPLFYMEDDYPSKLNNCEDAPLMLFVKGSINLERSRILSIVGTRSPTEYGRQFTASLTEALARHHPDVIVVSGLAFGIDICAHRAALKGGLDTVAVLGNGLGTVYPSLHRDTARQIVEKGALISEFLHDEKPESPNFVKRNRIIAGISDATLVVESGRKGGALITADIAFSYNRDVMAVPGRVGDKASEGCNYLIKSNRAALVEDLAGIEYLLGWQRTEEQPVSVQKEMFLSVDDEEKTMMELLQGMDRLTVDELSLRSHMPVSRASSLLLNLELKGLVRSLPGKSYTLS